MIIAHYKLSSVYIAKNGTSKLITGKSVFIYRESGVEAVTEDSVMTLVFCT